MECFLEGRKSPLSKKDQVYIDKLRNLILESVQSSVSKIKRPFATLLSGGADSGVLTAIAKPDIALTCRFPYGSKYDEFQSTLKTVKHVGVKHEVIVPKKKDFFKYIEDAILALGRTTIHFSLVPLYILFKRAREIGIKTVFSGEGPDEYLAGYTSYIYLDHEEKLFSRPELDNYHYSLEQYTGDRINRVARILKLNPELVKKNFGKYKSILSNLGYCDLKLRGITEMELAMAKRFNIRLLYPYMNKKIEDFCFKKVPDNLKIRNFTTKWIFRKVAEQYIPKEVVWRLNKMGGPVAPVGKWLGQKSEFDKTIYLNLQRHILKGGSLKTFKF